MPTPNTAALNLGGFGFNPAEPGPGVVVRFLAEKYSGPLKMGDRIVALDGREIPDAQHYVELMAKISEERPATVLVERGKERVRRHFLTPRLLRDWLVLFNRLIGNDTAGAELVTVGAPA